MYLNIAVPTSDGQPSKFGPSADRELMLESLDGKSAIKLSLHGATAKSVSSTEEGNKMTFGPVKVVSSLFVYDLTSRFGMTSTTVSSSKAFLMKARDVMMKEVSSSCNVVYIFRTLRCTEER